MYRWADPNKVIVRLSDNAAIPNDPRNGDWREFLNWVAAGNTPQAEEKPQLPDFSDLEQFERSFKALALCVAQLNGLTTAQMRALFKQKYDSLA